MSKIRNFTDEINQAKHLLNRSLYCGSTQLESLYFVDLHLSKLRENKIANKNISVTRSVCSVTFFKNLRRNKHGHKISRHWRIVSYISQAFIITANWHLKLEYCDCVRCCSVPHHGWPDIRVVPRGGHAARGGAHPAAPARAHRQHHRGLHHLLQHGSAQPRA